MQRRILVVDDDREMVVSLCDILELRAWETHQAFGGAEAIKAAVQLEVALVLMDVKMPQVDGVEALRAIKQQKPATQVVLMTAYAAQERLAKAEEYGVTRILRKPVDLPQLFQVLDGAAGAAGAVA